MCLCVVWGGACVVLVQVQGSTYCACTYQLECVCVE